MNLYNSKKLLLMQYGDLLNLLLSGEKKYKATYEFLKKNYPKIKNIKEGEDNYKRR
jgi:hypothetical protein